MKSGEVTTAVVPFAAKAEVVLDLSNLDELYKATTEKLWIRLQIFNREEPVGDLCQQLRWKSTLLCINHVKEARTYLFLQSCLLRK